jgi:hypothetical protein
MNLDLRWPLGMIFTLFGAILTGFGLASDAGLYRRSLDININLVWGLVVLLFGLTMLGLAYRGKRRGKA